MVYKYRYDRIITPFETNDLDPISFAKAVDGHFKLLISEGGGWKQANTPYTGCVSVIKNAKGEAISLGIYVHSGIVLTTNKAMNYSQFVPTSLFQFIDYYEPIE